MGTYWAGLSSPHAGSVVENSDLMIFAGAVLNDYTTVGWTALINCKTSIEMFPYKVVVCGKLYINVMLSDLLGALSAKAPKKEVTDTNYAVIETTSRKLIPILMADYRTYWPIKQQPHLTAFKSTCANLIYTIDSSLQFHARGIFVPSILSM